MESVQQTQASQQVAPAPNASPRNRQGGGQLETFGGSVTDGRFEVTATRSGAQVVDTETGEARNVARTKRGRFEGGLRIDVAENGSVNVAKGDDQVTLTAPAPRPASDIPPADGSPTPVVAPEDQPIAVPDVDPESFIGRVYANGDFVDDNGENVSLLADPIRIRNGLVRSTAQVGEASTHNTAGGLFSLNFEDNVPPAVKRATISAAEQWDRALDPPEGQEPIYVEIGVSEPQEGSNALATAFTPGNNHVSVLGLVGMGDDVAALLAAAEESVRNPNPVAGFIQFSEDTINSPIQFDILLHEFAHVLGVNSSTIPRQDLIQEDPNGQLSFPNGVTAPAAVFGPEGGDPNLAQVANEILVNDLPVGLGGIPVNNEGVDADGEVILDPGHLNEVDFGTELLTPEIDGVPDPETGRVAPLTQITLAIFELLGYTANFDEAENELAAMLEPERFENPA